MIINAKAGSGGIDAHRATNSVELPLPGTSAFTRVFDALCGARLGRGESCADDPRSLYFANAELPLYGPTFEISK